jgi:hypothetical protein
LNKPIAYKNLSKKKFIKKNAPPTKLNRILREVTIWTVLLVVLRCNSFRKTGPAEKKAEKAKAR